MMNTPGKKTGKKADSQDEVQNSDFGTVLASARKAKNYTVEEVSEYLKIPGHVITAIEHNNLAELPPPTFTQGYIRAYARYLEAAEDEVLEMYNLAVPRELGSELKSRSKLPNEASSQSPLVKLITMALIFSGIAAVVYGSFNYYQQKAGVMESQLESKQQSFTGSSLNSPASMSGTQHLSIKQNTRSTEADESITANTATAASDAVSTSAEMNNSLSSSSINSEADGQVATSNNTEVIVQANVPVKDDVIEIFAEEGAWLEVYDASEQRLFYNMLNKGGKKTLTGQAPFRLALGNAGSTRISVNSIELDINNFIRSNNTASFMVDVKDNKASLY